MQSKIQCIIVDDEPMAREILVTHLKKMENVTIIQCCKNAIEAYNAIASNIVDLIFLDINMPEISGLSFAKSINKDIKVIFTTAYREYGVDGFNLQAVDYLLKPISFERLAQAVHKFAKEQLKNKGEERNETVAKRDFFFVRSERKMIKINFSEINYIESLSDYVKIHLSNEQIVTRETLSNIETKLSQNHFIRVHRSYIVSMLKITSFTNEFIEIGNKAIPISRGYKTSVLNRLENN